MLVIKSLDELTAYVMARKEMIVRQRGNSAKHGSWESGAIYAFEEALKAIQAIQHQKDKEESEKKST